MADGETRTTCDEASPYSRHIPALDGIRGLAVMGVLASHFFSGAERSPVTRLIGSLLRFGATGVDLFFVLSGFLITGILYDSLGEPHYFRKFYARRILRIFPLYYGVIAMFLVIALFTHTSTYRELLSLGLYLQNTNWIAPPIEMFQGPLPLHHFWSLAVEEQFYMFWPLLVFFIKRRRSLLWVCALSVVLCPILRIVVWSHGAGYVWVQTNTALRADSLLAGGGLALLLRTRMHDRVLRWAPFCILPTFLIAFFLLGNPYGDAPETASPALWNAVQTGVRYSFLIAAYAGLLSWAIANGAGRRLFSVTAMRTLGKYSYGIYVWHLIVFFYTSHAVRAFIAAHLTANKAGIVAVSGLVELGLSVGVAYVSYQLYERHFLRLKRYFAYGTRPAMA